MERWRGRRCDRGVERLIVRGKGGDSVRKDGEMNCESEGIVCVL